MTEDIIYIELTNNSKLLNIDKKIKTMRYLGNKTDLLDFIYEIIYKYKKIHCLKPTIIDGFGGTGSITQYFNRHGFNVISNDINDYSYKLCYSRNNISKEDINFNDLKLDIKQVLNILNKKKRKGFIYNNYSPNSSLKYERKYFTNDNAEIIDGIRCQIQEWFDNKQITKKEYIHLIAILIETTSLYSNIPGTYGSFLNKWDSRALKTLTLTEDIHINLLAKHTHRNYTYNDNLKNIIDSLEADILYLDPPYNERDYSMYYHVLETISRYDTPELKDNKTGTKQIINTSDWCKKAKAANELEYIIKNSNAKLVLLSYNNEGIISLDNIKDIFEKYGKYSNERKQVRRFKCNTTKNDIIVYEYIHILERSILEINSPKQLSPTSSITDYEYILESDSPKQLSSTSSITDYGSIMNICCLAGMENIPAKSIDLICCDLPYGLSECKWDTPIDIDELWKSYTRILKDYGTIVLFGQQPFTSRLVTSNYKMFKYSLVWQKSKPGGFAQAPYKVLCEHEDILIFTHGKTTKNSKNRMTYNPQGTQSCNIEMKGKTGSTEHRKGRKTQKDYVQTTTNYPRSVLKFNNEGKVSHPTQKPLLMIEYLIKTYSNENEIILDNCMGSGTTAIACIKNNRKYIGYETDKNYFNICVERITNTIENL